MLTADGGGGSSQYSAGTQRENLAFIASTQLADIEDAKSAWTGTADQAADISDLVVRRLDELTAEGGWTGSGATAFRTMIMHDLVEPLRRYEEVARRNAKGYQPLVQSVTRAHGTATYNNIPWDVDTSWFVTRKDIEQGLLSQLEESVQGEDEDYEKAKADAPYEIKRGNDALVKSVSRQQWEANEAVNPMTPAPAVFGRVGSPVSAAQHRFDRMMETEALNTSVHSNVSSAAQGIDTELARFGPAPVEEFEFSGGKYKSQLPGGSGGTGGSDTGGPTPGGPNPAGPTPGGPTTGGPNPAGPTTGGPDTGGPTPAGPNSAGPTTGGPDTGGPDTGGPDTGGPRPGGPDGPGGPTPGGPDTGRPDTGRPGPDGSGQGGPHRLGPNTFDTPGPGSGGHDGLSGPGGGLEATGPGLSGPDGTIGGPGSLETRPVQSAEGTTAAGVAPIGAPAAPVAPTGGAMPSVPTGVPSGGAGGLGALPMATAGGGAPGTSFSVAAGGRPAVMAGAHGAVPGTGAGPGVSAGPHAGAGGSGAGATGAGSGSGQGPAGGPMGRRGQSSEEDEEQTAVDGTWLEEDESVWGARSAAPPSEIR